jgi:hypothetical protein
LAYFIKTNGRIGVVLPRINDFEIIFNYFSDPETSLLNYHNLSMKYLILKEIKVIQIKKEMNMKEKKMIL